MHDTTLPTLQAKTALEEAAAEAQRKQELMDELVVLLGTEKQEKTDDINYLETEIDFAKIGKTRAFEATHVSAAELEKREGIAQ